MCGIDESITSKAQLLYQDIVRGEDISKHFMTFTEEESIRLKKAVRSVIYTETLLTNSEPQSVAVRRFIAQKIENMTGVHSFLRSLTQCE